MESLAQVAAAMAPDVMVAPGLSTQDLETLMEDLAEFLD